MSESKRPVWKNKKHRVVLKTIGGEEIIQEFKMPELIYE